MLNTNGFYKLENNQLLFASSFIESPSYQLNKEDKDNYTYPIDGWYWFESEEIARQFFNLPKIIEQTSPKRMFKLPQITG